MKIYHKQAGLISGVCRERGVRVVNKNIAEVHMLCMIICSRVLSAVLFCLSLMCVVVQRKMCQSKICCLSKIMFGL